MAFNPLTQTFDTIADLKTRKGTDGASVEVLGYYIKGDGGKGSYYYDDASVETENGGTIIKPTNVSVGRWKLVHNGEVNAANFGVVTGDTAQNAQITAALATSGVKTLVFNHLITKSYTIASAITVPAGIVLKFENDNKFIFSGGSLSGGLIDCDYRKQCFGGDLTVTGLENITRSAMWFGAKPDAISGNPTPTDNLIPAQKAVDSCIVPGKVYFPGAVAGTGYFYNFSTTWTVTKRVEIYGDGYGSVTTFLFPNNGPGLKLFASSGGIRVHDLRIRGNYSAVGIGIGYNSSTAHGLIIKSNNTTIDRVMVINFDGNGLDIDGDSGGNANSFKVSECYFQGNGRAGSYTHGADANAGTFTNCHWDNNKRWGLWEFSFLGNNYYGGGINNNVITSVGQLTVIKYRAAVSHGGNRYRVKNNSSSHTNKEPGVAADWATYWTLIEAGGLDATYQAWSAVRTYATPVYYYAKTDHSGIEPTITTDWEDDWVEISVTADWIEWFADTQYYHGGGARADNVNGRNRFDGIYIEGGMPVMHNTSFGIVIGGFLASGGAVENSLGAGNDGLITSSPFSIRAIDNGEDAFIINRNETMGDEFIIMEDELSGGYIKIGGASELCFLPTIRIQPENSSNGNAAVFISEITDGVGSNAAFRFSSRTTAGGAIATNNLFAFQNLSTNVLTIAANGMLTNSALSGTGNRLIQAGVGGAITAMGWTVPVGNGTSGQVFTSDGAGGTSWTTPSGGGGSGDMILASAQTNTGAKTYNNGTLLLRNVANTFNGSFTNTNTADRIYTLQNAAGTLAFLSDITGTNSGTNTGDQSTITGNSGSATILQTGRTIAITGDLAYTSPSFNGSANVTTAGTLATVNSNVGSFGSATQAGTFTVNAKGLITAASNTSIQIAESQVTNLTTDLAAKQGTITLTTTGSSGASTLIGSTLNIPQYTGGGGGETNTASNLGGGLANYSTKVGVDLQFNSFAAVDFDLASNLISIDATKWAVLASPTFTGTPTLPTGTIGTTQSAGNSTTALATTAFVTTADNLKAPLASPTFTGIVTIPTPFTLGAVSVLPTGTELNFVDGVTSSIQTQLDSKQGTITLTTTGTSGAATLIGATLNIPQYTGGGGGDVTKVGTPVDNYVGVWTGDGTIEGSANLQFNGTQLGIQGVPGFPLDIWNGSVGIVLGADNGASTRTNNLQKHARIGVAHYTNSEEPSAILYYSNSSATNILHFGGGTGTMNAASDIKFYTAANSTTTTGTEKMALDNSIFIINDGGLNFDVRMESDTDANMFVLDANANTIGGIGIGIAAGSITSTFHLRAGTATAGTSPLKFTSGTLLTTAEAGAVEFLTDAFYGTITTGAARKQFLFTDGSAASLTSFPTLNQNTTGSAATLTTSRNINGTAFNGSADITVTAAAGTLTGTVLNATVVTSSLTAHGTITSGGLGTGAVIGGVTMTLGSDAANDIYYRNGSGVLTRLANGTTGQFLSASTGAAPSWATPSGSGNVSKVGTPADNQIGIWTGDGTIEGSAQLTFTGQALQLASTNTTQATTSSILAVAANSLTTGTVQYIASSTITTGNLLNLVTTGTAAAAGNEALNIDRSGTNGTSSITVTGARITLANTGTTSTNVGLDVAVSGASTNTAITANSDVEITDTTKGVILKSPDGTRWRLTIGNTGIITTTSL